jgi:hypothetical protein
MTRKIILFFLFIFAGSDLQIYIPEYMEMDRWKAISARPQMAVLAHG